MYNGHLSFEELEQLNQQKGPAENQSHIATCRQCHVLLEKYQAVSAKLEQLASVRIGARNGMNCPDERIWFDVAAGTLSSEESLKHVQHAAECSSCAQRLRVATRMFQEELSAEEETEIAALPSSLSTQQQGLARRLSSVISQQSKSGFAQGRKRSFWKPLSYAFATAAVLVFIAFLSLGSLTDTLLARGYTQRGTLEYRIAKADPPKEGIRGTIEEKERPVSLVMADLLIRARLAMSPKSAYWLAEKGRLELIEGKTSAALEALQVAHALDPTSKPIAIDLASASLVHYSGHQHAMELFKAEEELLKVLPSNQDDLEVLRRDPNNLLAVYNLALIYELTGSLDQAIREWEFYLRLDSTSAWAGEARRRVETLKDQKRGKAPPIPTAPVTDWLTYIDSGEPNATEAALEVAFLEWLPRRSKTAVGLEGLLLHLSAKLQEEHADNWLADALRTAPDFEIDQGFAKLKLAIEENATGDFESAAHEAAAAQLVFHRTGNIAGMMRSELEEIYSYQRAVESQSCLVAASKLQGSLIGHSFTWINIQLVLDRASCFNQLGRLQESKADSDEALKIASKSGYKIALSRAKGIRASQATARGNHEFALEQDVEGLRECWSDWYPVERIFQFYSDVTFNAESAQLWHVAYDTGKQVVNVIEHSTHRELEAIARYRIANAALILNESKGATLEINEADRLLSALPQNNTTIRYRTNAIVGLAKAKFDSGRESEALILLEQSTAQATPTENRLFARPFFQFSGNLALRNGRLRDAEMAYGDAVEIAESGLDILKNWRDRMIWTRENEPSYRGLIQAKLQQNDALGSLEIWEQYKAALVRSRRISKNSTMREFGASVHDPLLRSLHEVEDERLHMKTSQVVISYVVLQNVIVGWVLDLRGVMATVLPISADALFNLVQQFTTECSNPNSDLELLKAHARRLYQILIDPFNDHLLNAGTLVIEADGELDNLPFEVLITNQNRYLIEEKRVVYSPGFVFCRYLRPPHHIGSFDKALIVGSPALAEVWQRFLPPLPSAEREAKELAAKFRGSTLLTGTKAFYGAFQSALRETTLFHFAGHSIHTTSGVGLLLAPGPDELRTRDGLFTFEGLNPHSVQKLQLVVLSSCATAYIDHPAAERFLDPLFVAGVSQVIATRWNIDSLATLAFMERFYEQLLSPALSEISLQRSATSILAQRLTLHPYYWAAFKLIGVV